MAFPTIYRRACRAAALAMAAVLYTAGIPAPARAAEKFPRVERDAVLAEQKARDAEWREKIGAAGKTHILFTEAEWPQVIAEVAQVEPEHPFRRYVDEALGKLLEKPVPVYATPEEISERTKLSLYSAKEELWQRAVGEDLVTLSLVLKLGIAGSDERTAQCRARLHDLVMAACSWPTWGRGNSSIPDNADLACGHLSIGISYAYNLHPQAFSDAEREKIRNAMREKVKGTLSGLYGAAYWATGYQDNHLQVDVAGLGLAGAAFYTEIPEAPEWLAAAKLAHANIARFSQTDGSSDEGIPYWSYARWATVHYIEGTRPVTGADAMYKEAFMRNAISWRLYSSTCGFGGTLPWGDAPAKDYYGPHFILQRVGTVCEDPTGLWLTLALPFRPQGGSDVPTLSLVFGRQDFMGKGKAALARYAPTAGDKAKARDADKASDKPGATAQAGGAFTPGLDAHFAVNDSVTTRSGWAADDYILAMKSGFTNRNHSHLDAGALAFAYGSRWSLRAPGYGKGAGQHEYWDSSRMRWVYFSNATESHTALLINGKNQRHDGKARGTVDQFLTAPAWAWASADLTSAYYDAKSVRRSLLHRRGDYALVFDTVTATSPGKYGYPRAAALIKAGRPLPADDRPASGEGAAPQEDVTVEWLAQTGENMEVVGGPGLIADEKLLIPQAQSKDEARPWQKNLTSARIPGGGDARNRELLVTPLLPSSATFVKREPTAERIDLPREAIRTYGFLTAGKPGEAIHTIVMLEPRPAPAPAPATAAPAPRLQASCIPTSTKEKGDNLQLVTVAGDGWIDRIVVPTTAMDTLSLPIRKGDGTALPGYRTTTFLAKAQLIAVRDVAVPDTGQPAEVFSSESTLAVQATEFTLGDLRYKGPAVCVAIDRIGKRTWLLHADTDLRAGFTPPEGTALHEIPNPTPAPGAGPRYIISASPRDAALAEARKWEQAQRLRR